MSIPRNKHRKSDIAADLMNQPQELPAHVIDAVRRGNKIEAIKLLREHAGIGLKEAKDAVDAFERSSPVARATGSPGQVRQLPRAWIGVAVLLGVAAYFLLR